MSPADHEASVLARGAERASFRGRKVMLQAVEVPLEANYGDEAQDSEYGAREGAWCEPGAVISNRAGPEINE